MDELLCMENVIFWAPMVVGTLLYVVSSLAGGIRRLGRPRAISCRDRVSRGGRCGRRRCGTPSRRNEGDSRRDRELLRLGKVASGSGSGQPAFGWGIAGMVLNQILGRSSIGITMAVSGLVALAYKVCHLAPARYFSRLSELLPNGAVVSAGGRGALHRIGQERTVRILRSYNNCRPALPCQTRAAFDPQRRGVYIVT